MSYNTPVDKLVPLATKELVDLYVQAHPVLNTREEVRTNANTYLEVASANAQSTDSIDTVKKAQATIAVKEAGNATLKGTGLVNYTRLLLDELLFTKLQTVSGLESSSFSYQANGEYSVSFDVDPFYGETGEMLENTVTPVIQELGNTIRDELLGSTFNQSEMGDLSISYSLVENYTHPENGLSGPVFKASFTVADSIGMVGRTVNVTFEVATSRKAAVDNRDDIGTEEPVEVNAFN